MFVPKVVLLVTYQRHMQVQQLDSIITEDTNIAAQFTAGYSVLSDKRFNVQDSFLRYKVTPRIPLFVRIKREKLQLESK